MRLALSLVASLVMPAFAGAADRADALVADFEGETYGEGWKTTGTAFGKGPARGTLPNQMAVSGFLGKGLVNSFAGGDDSTGTLTSPEITIDRKHINFLIGGGKHPGKTCVNLLVGGKVVRTATGPNDKPGGTEHLDWHTWDVAEFEGKKAVIEIVDEQKGGWGHINVDHIVQSDKKKQTELKTYTIDISRQYLHFAVKTGAPKRRVRLVVDKEVVREFDVELGLPGGYDLVAALTARDFWAPYDVSAFKGKKLTVEAVLPADAKLAEVIDHWDGWWNADDLYKEKHRPLFHFTCRTGWLNDPNGLVYADGEWHLYYQHNPFGREWGNMHWGHATSKDLFRWKEHPIAFYPKKYGDWAFSGSAVVDKENTSGLGTKAKPPLVVAYTSTARGECIAYSNDNGRHWRELDKNPVVKHSGRDPKLVWHEPTKKWVMAVYDEAKKEQGTAFYTSTNLKEWKFASRIDGFYECPDLFELPGGNFALMGGPPKMKWVLYAADGSTFKPDHKEKKQLWYGNFYAAQTFDNAPPFVWKNSIGPVIPDRPRRVQIGWAQGVTFPGTAFNQQMTVPVDLSLVEDKGGQWLVAAPVHELATLRDGKPVVAINMPEGAKAGDARTLADNLDAFEADMTLHVGKATGFVFDLRGTKLTYDAAKGTLTCKGVTAPVQTRDGMLDFKVLVDRGSVEVFADSGRVAMSVAALPTEKNGKLVFTPTGGDVTLRVVTVHRIKSAWGK